MVDERSYSELVDHHPEPLEEGTERVETSTHWVERSDGSVASPTCSVGWRTAGSLKLPTRFFALPSR